MTSSRAAVVEIIERRRKPAQDSVGASIVVPTEVRINGQTVALPKGHPIQVHDLSDRDPAMVTLTVYAKRIFVGQEDIDEEVIDEVAAATKALLDAQREVMASQLRASEALKLAQRRLATARDRLHDASESVPTGEVTE